MQSWKDDWNVFAHDVMQVRPSEWQQEGLHMIQHNKRTSFCSATSMGKDWLGSLASWCFLLLTPDFDANGILQTALVINTGPSAAQVNTIMLGELKSKFYGSALPKLVKAGLWDFKLTQKGVHFNIPTGMDENPKFGNYAKWSLEAFKGDEYNVERWTGYHNENIMVVATEASGLPPLIYEGIEGCLQNNSRLVLLHNPNFSQGEAYESMKDPQYKSKRIPAFESDNFKLGKQMYDGIITPEEYQKLRYPGQLDYSWVKDRVNKKGWTIKINESEKDLSKHDFEFEGKWYRPSRVCKIKILAVHPESSDENLIPLSWIEAAQDRWLEATEKGIEQSKGIRGVDVSGQGRDSTVFIDRYGDYVAHPRVIIPLKPETAHMETSAHINKDASSFNAIMVDTIGEGSGVFSGCKEAGIDNVYSFKNSYGAKGLTDVTGTMKFKNMRAYVHWALRDALNPQFDAKLMLPPSDELKSQLAEIKYMYDRKTGELIIEPKDELSARLGGSPDESDALTQTFAPIDRLIAAIQKKSYRPSPGAFGG
ncbi:MAG: hypothetical protein MIO92_10525 [Methanosarcinaceae archaeon]|nr:hypothetical protein [Methanosarcinaceae archaeon]